MHRYVGDALIATWPLGTPEENARPICGVFACRDTLEAARSDLLRRHGHIPGFRASLHSGPLVAGEIGGFKREIALLGDAMNTAARLEQTCRTTGHDLLASKPLLNRTAVPDGIVVTSIGSHVLRGKSERLELFALERGTQRRIDRHSDVARALQKMTRRARVPPGGALAVLCGQDPAPPAKPTNGGDLRRACPSSRLRKNRVAHALEQGHILRHTSGMEDGR